ncbi:MULTISPECIES: vWA domain-containing protein [Arthrospira]|jgi:Ca-activated chloride channel family protein|uniref:VWFA domain-containing protein n=1 Tax=Limnospira platensis NIES-46 TaxID=1236695 RepID=A0A5M3T379_LIMPL|nr:MULTISPECIES: vWA domain-containing protein [Arthrospira]AMW29195.1 hypothetical protein AP285_15715 [Arthrospira platensis YZ]KDR58641.1 von Willebrand factor A [Arthrospira platensis str. Paraca]MBD2669173.1 VWA domain-containing protein [Arthrospira platensis FACHB-439]MBD2710991.1 VWA domain-containing protein [Arthrospira platensis FACHB-835]MDF2213065.1 VWA domain-containing protein [Arthrospira platensis NCB002]MDT9295458.1 VWA domain-containing protein [Arthrospira platensis PCC 73
MIIQLNNITKKINKPLLFGLCGGAGCLLGALIFGEIWLYLTRQPPGFLTKPQAVVMLIDTSGSMSGSKLPEVQRAASEFVSRQNLKRDDLAVVEFSSRASVVADFTRDERELQQAIARLSAWGGTNLSEGFNLATSVLQNSDRPGNILLFTDGEPNNRRMAASIAQQIRASGINLVAVGTGDAPVNYLTALTGDPDLVFYANFGDLDSAFRGAEKAIYGQQLVESDESGNYGFFFGVFRIGVWTVFLAVGTSLALIVGQNYNLRRRLLSWEEGSLGAGGALMAGFIGGVVGQVVFLPSAYLPVLSVVARLTGWTVLGTLVGGGMSLFVPNLPRKNAMIAGAVGGVFGSLSFLVLEAVTGVILARLAGATILGFCIGLAIALSEKLYSSLYSSALLWVHWNNQECTMVSLGEKPIEIGSSRNAHVYLPKDAGFPEQFAQIFIEDGQVILEFDSSLSQHPKFGKMKRFKQELNDGDRRQFGDIILEVQERL